MRLKKARLPITDFINQNKIISTCINFTLSLFYTSIRFALKPFNYKDTNIVVISLHRLGDTIFTLPAIREIQKQFGKQVIIVCFPESIPIYKLEFADLRFCPVEHNEFYFGQRIANRSAKSKLRALKPGTLLDLTGTMSSASMIFNIRAEKIYGINRNQFKSIYDHFIPVREIPKLIDIYLDAISPIVKSINRTKLNEQKKSVNLFGKILIHPFAGWKEKEWNLKKFIILAVRLNANYRVSLIIQKSQLSNDIINELNNSNIDLIQTDSVEELIKNIKECSLLIDNDSGPVNIANFLGKPTFSVYGATNPDFTASKEAHQIFIQKELNCSSKRNEKYCAIGVGIYECPGVQCMNLLTVDEVYDKLTPLIEDYCNNKK